MKTLIDGKNYFNENSFNEMCEALERKETIEVYIDCIGHNRNNMEQEAYREELKNKYGERLETIQVKGSYSYSYMYKLLSL